MAPAGTLQVFKGGRFAPTRSSREESRLPSPYRQDSPYRFSDEVQAAQASNLPIVALESSLIAHGFPRPENLALAREIESSVRNGGATPATIAVVNGDVCIGLSEAELRLIAEDDAVRKCSSRDLAFLIANQLNGGTTVASTVRVCAAVGLQVFATGGIGGVHRGVETSHDVSADLVELGRSRVTVVCAGAKVLLDLPATLEVLETQSVPLIGFGCNEFPSFYAVHSGLPLSQRVDDIEALAGVVQAHQVLNAPSSLVVCNPPPASHALDAGELETFVREALANADAKAVSGPDVTPFVLAELARLSGGRTRDCNRALVLDNVRVATELAVALANTSR